jgi:hypothetical protein
VRLSDHLRAWSDDDLAWLLRARPDLGPAAEGGFGALARRAATPASLGRALLRADVGMLVVVEALCVRHPVSFDELTQLLGTGDRAGVAAAVERLRRQGLALVHDGLVDPVDRLPELFPHPFGLGRTFTELACQLSPARLRALAARHGLDVGDAPAPAVAAAVGRWLAGGDTVAELLDGGPPAARDLLGYLATEGMARLDLPAAADHPLADGDPRVWLVEQGLVVPVAPGQAEVVREAALRLRSGGLAPQASLRPPALEAQPGPAPAVVDEAAAAAAARFLTAAEDLVRCLGERPATIRKEGGVGVRELGRLGREIGFDRRDTARLLELVAAAGLVHTDRDRVRTTDRALHWLGSERGLRFMVLVESWLDTERLPSVALGELPSAGRPGALQAVEVLVDAPGARRDLLATAAAVPEGEVVSTAELVAAAVWRAPNRWGVDEATVAVTTRWTVEEAALLGLLAEGCATAVARALARPDRAGLALALAAALPPEPVPARSPGHLAAPGGGGRPEGAGRVRVLAAATVLVTDEARAIEVASHPRAGRLGLRLVAPTVLVASVGAAAVVEELRGWGHRPVLDGVVVTLADRAPAASPEPAPGWVGAVPPDDLGPAEAAELVGLLRHADAETAVPGDLAGAPSPRVVLERHRNRSVVVEHFHDGRLVATSGVVVAVRSDTALVLAGRRLVPIALGGVVRVGVA